MAVQSNQEGIQSFINPEGKVGDDRAETISVALGNIAAALGFNPDNDSGIIA